MIFVDSNIPMYLIGSPHPYRDEARRTLEALAIAGERLVTSAEVLQEIPHRYSAVRRQDAIHPAFSALLDLVDKVFSVTPADALRARDIVFSVPAVSSRHALHLAVMDRHGVSRILSFDRGFDRAPGCERFPS